jgi:pimeloyl-ACP methyl ester carboxylesterase
MKLAQKIAIRYIRTKLHLLAVVSPLKAATHALKLFCTPFKRSGKEAPPVFKQAKRIPLLVDNTAIVAYQWNKGANRKVLILHGFESAAKSFDRYINLFIEKGYEVLAVDAPAHGESGGKHITLPLYIKTIEAVYNHCGPINSFMAHSFGGLAITHFLEQLQHNDACRIALIAPATETKTAIDDFFRLLQLNKAVRKAFDQMITDVTGVPPEHFSIPRAIHHLKAQVLWLHDEHDDVTPLHDVQPIMAAQLPNVQFIITQQLGHRKIYRNDSVVKAVVDFL